MGLTELAANAADGRHNQGGIYSVVFTTEKEKTKFEIYLLKGEAKSPEQVADDLQRAKDWLLTQREFKGLPISE